MVKSQQRSQKQKARRLHHLTTALIITIVAILALCLVLLAIIPRRPHCPSLIGTWRYSGTEYSGDYIYTFKKDGTGSYLTPEGEYIFTYADDVETFSILFSGNTRYNVYPYSIDEDGSTLTVLDENREPVPYACQ